jgi:hypothetical protein
LSFPPFLDQFVGFDLFVHASPGGGPGDQLGFHLELARAFTFFSEMEAFFLDKNK